MSPTARESYRTRSRSSALTVRHCRFTMRAQRVPESVEPSFAVTICVDTHDHSPPAAAIPSPPLSSDDSSHARHPYRITGIPYHYHRQRRPPNTPEMSAEWTRWQGVLGLSAPLDTWISAPEGYTGVALGPAEDESDESSEWDEGSSPPPVQARRPKQPRTVSFAGGAGGTRTSSRAKKTVNYVPEHPSAPFKRPFVFPADKPRHPTSTPVWTPSVLARVETLGHVVPVTPFQPPANSEKIAPIHRTPFTPSWQHDIRAGLATSPALVVDTTANALVAQDPRIRRQRKAERAVSRSPEEAATFGLLDLAASSPHVGLGINNLASHSHHSSSQRTHIPSSDLRSHPSSTHILQPPTFPFHIDSHDRPSFVLLPRLPPPDSQSSTGKATAQAPPMSSFYPTPGMSNERGRGHSRKGSGAMVIPTTTISANSIPEFTSGRGGSPWMERGDERSRWG
jgi:hypothetical protein